VSTPIDRRRFIAGSVAAGGAIAGAGALGFPATARAGGEPLGAGGHPMSPRDLAASAGRIGNGDPLALLDLAALDRNIATIAAFAAGRGWAARPALKAFRCPRLSSYVLGRLPQPRGMVFDLGEADELARIGPPGLDLMMGWVPAPAELERFLMGRPSTKKPHRIRLLVDGVESARDLTRLAATTRRPLPLDVALDLDSGMGRGGIDSKDEMAAVLQVLRAAGSRVQLGAIVCYDGHASLVPPAAARRIVVEQARSYLRRGLGWLHELGADLIGDRALIVNGPGSTSFRQWPEGSEINEISPGNAFVFPSTLDQFDTDGLSNAVVLCAPVTRITSDSPSLPLTQTTLPGSTQQEVLVKSAAWSAIDSIATAIWPEGITSDTLSGGLNAFVVPKGSRKRGEHVLFRPVEAWFAIDEFDALHAVREGRHVRTWPTVRRWGGTGQASR
jgi:D-serine deaminase-like pyridoxal phosphate-dependent protein